MCKNRHDAYGADSACGIVAQRESGARGEEGAFCGPMD